MGRTLIVATLILLTLVVFECAHAAEDVKLITLDPGHFHAALFQREMLPGVAETASVYAPLGPDLAAHLNRVAQFNLRRENPAHWKLDVRAGPDFFEQMLNERPGNVVVLSGRNASKIDRIEAIVRARLNVLADKPWIIEPEALPKLHAALDAADRNGVIAYDAMTERFEISCLIQRELVGDREIFGESVKGAPEEPAVYLESVHYLLKEIGGVPNLRPAWFFDIHEQGEGLADVGTHLVERVQWTLFPNQPIDHARDIQVLRGTRWPTVLELAQFQRVTGSAEFPEFLDEAVKGKQLEYFCNNSVNYTLRGIHVKLVVRWDFEAQPGASDTQFALFRGSKARIEVRQGQDENFRPEVFVIPANGQTQAAVRDALKRKVETLQNAFPGLALAGQDDCFHVVIPESLRAGHETHFSLLCQRFLDYVRHPKSLPAWEKPNLLAKYYVTTQGIELARQNAAEPSIHESVKP